MFPLTMSALLYISDPVIKSLLTTRDVIPLVEDAFAAYARGEAHMPSKVYLDLPGIEGDFRAMPAYIRESGACGLKWVNAHPRNPERGLLSVMAVILLSRAETGEPLAILDGTRITNLRTGAAGGVAIKHLARRDTPAVALVGCGVQAHTQLEAARAVRNLQSVRVWGHEAGLADQFIEREKETRAGQGSDLEFRPVASVEECVDGADLVITTTPSRKPLVQRDWLKPGVHINAMGADAEGKQELDPAILRDAVVVLDDSGQASHSGEINVPLTRGDYTREQVRGTLGEVIIGMVPGRASDDEITVFDSTGLAIQDMAVAWHLFERCRETDRGRVLADPDASSDASANS